MDYCILLWTANLAQEQNSPDKETIKIRELQTVTYKARLKKKYFVFRENKDHFQM